MKSYNFWGKDLENSIAAINKNIRLIIDALGGGEIHSIERTNNKILQILDRYCGIDYIWIRDEKARGIASRVQWKKNWETFTIRCERKSGAETEYKKRLKTIGESFSPHLTMQMYCNDKVENKFEAMAIIKTEDLYFLIVTRPELFHESKSDNLFIYVHWNDIKYKTDTNILIKRRGKELEGELRLN